MTTLLQLTNDNSDKNTLLFTDSQDVFDTLQNSTNVNPEYFADITGIFAVIGSDGIEEIFLTEDNSPWDNDAEYDLEDYYVD